jgi:hypothetical protein
VTEPLAALLDRPRIYRHRKRGTTYQFVGRAKMQIGPESLRNLDGDQDVVCHVLEQKSYVIYQSIADGSLWVRPESEFFDGRFEEVK